MKSIHDPRYFQLIQRLIVAREVAAVTQVQLAELLDRPQSYIVELADWLKALHVPAQQLLADLTWWPD
jgi:hypothetical protein